MTNFTCQDCDKRIGCFLNTCEKITNAPKNPCDNCHYQICQDMAKCHEYQAYLKRCREFGINMR
jgi:hypothetical protein